MSKGNMLLGHARGKVGDIVFSRSNGQQIVRSRAAVVKNPQSEAQMIQRTLLNTVAQAYSKMVAICDHSFEGVQQGQKTMSAFLSANLKLLRSKLANTIAYGGTLNDVTCFSPVGTNFMVQNEYVISKGSLPEIIPSIPSGAAITLMTLGGVGTTYEDFINAYGLVRGDQITFLGCYENGVGGVFFSYARVILDPRNADGSEASLNVALIDGSTVNLPNPRNEAEGVVFAVSGSELSVQLRNQHMVSAAVIVSRQNSDGTWKRSNASMVLDDGWSFYSDYSMAYALAYAQDAFATESEVYLNNAGTARTATSAAGSVSSALVRSLLLNDVQSTTSVSLDINSGSTTISSAGTYSLIANCNSGVVEAGGMGAICLIADGGSTALLSANIGNAGGLAASASKALSAADNGTYNIVAYKDATDVDTAQILGTVTIAIS